MFKFSRLLWYSPLLPNIWNAQPSLEVWLIIGSLIQLFPDPCNEWVFQLLQWNIGQLRVTLNASLNFTCADWRCSSCWRSCLRYWGQWGAVPSRLPPAAVGCCPTFPQRPSPADLSPKLVSDAASLWSSAQEAQELFNVFPAQGLWWRKL